MSARHAVLSSARLHRAATPTALCLQQQSACVYRRPRGLFNRACAHARTRTAPVIIRKTRLSVMVIAMYALTKTSTAIGAQKTNSGNIDNNLISMIITCINHNPSNPPSKFPIHLSTDGTAESHTHTHPTVHVHSTALNTQSLALTPRQHVQNPESTPPKHVHWHSTRRRRGFLSATYHRIIVPALTPSQGKCRDTNTHTHDKRDPSLRRWFAPTRPDTRTRASHASIRMRAPAHTQSKSP